MKLLKIQEGTAQYNLNEALDALVTLTDRSQKTVHSEEQMKFLELSNKPTLALYMGFPEQLVPSEIKNQRLQPFLPPPGKGANQGPPTSIKKKKQIFKQPEVHPIRAQEDPPSRGEPQYTKNQEDIGTVEPLEFYNKLCDSENNLLIVFNKLNILSIPVVLLI